MEDPTQPEIPPQPLTRGVANPHVIDLITEDPASGEVVLVMLEPRPWDSEAEQLRQLEAKFNSYLEYTLGGHLAKQYPQYEGRTLRFQLDCVENPPQKDGGFFTAMTNYAAGEKIRFVIRVGEVDTETPVIAGDAGEPPN